MLSTTLVRAISSSAASATSTRSPSANISACPDGAGSATGCTGTRSSCSAFGPAYLFILQHRLPVGMMRKGWQPWISTMATNAAIALLIVGTMWLVGVKPFLLVHLPIALLAASIGVWLFYVQHQFEDTFWAEPPSWTLHEAALHGSSYYDLPGILRWFTANIGVHHVHHLCSRIPYYRLPQVLRDHPELKGHWAADAAAELWLRAADALG